MKRKIIDWIAGRKGLQQIFETMYRASLYGMNFGNGGNFRISGEGFAIKYIKSRLPRNGKTLLLFDVGANKGYYSNDLATMFSGTEFMIHSFEPSRVTFEELLKNTGADKHMIPNNFGFGEKNETLKLFTTGPLSGLSSVYERRLEHFGIDMSQYEEIFIRTIDDYCVEKGIDRINFLKLDIEGHEFKCLLGAKQMLERKQIDFIQFEFGGCNIDSRTYFQDFWYLLHENYHIFRIVKNGLVPLEKYNERLEIFKNINFLAELKT